MMMSVMSDVVRHVANRQLMEVDQESKSDLWLNVFSSCLMILPWSDYVMVSCFPNAIIANVPECPYGWEIGQLSLGGVCYTGAVSGGYFRFIIPDLTPKNHSYCGTMAEVRERGHTHTLHLQRERSYTLQL